MRAVYSSQGEILVKDAASPSGEGELITVTSAGICGSDLHLVKSGLSGVILGHEFGGLTSDGRLVAVRPAGSCGACPACQRGLTNTCRSAIGALHGTSVDGGLAELVRVDPSQIYDMPGGSDPTSVALVEPLAVVVHGVQRVTLLPGMTALIVGSGSIGLLTAAVLLDRGVHVDIVCRHPHQQRAAEAIGATARATAGSNYNVSFDAVCTQASLDACIGATEPGGTVVEFGMIWEPIHLSNVMMLREISIVPSIFYSHDHSHDDFLVAIEFLGRHPNLASHVVTHHFALEDAPLAFAAAADRQSGAIKIHLTSA